MVSDSSTARLFTTYLDFVDVHQRIHEANGLLAFIRQEKFSSRAAASPALERFVFISQTMR